VRLTNPVGVMLNHSHLIQTGPRHPADVQLEIDQGRVGLANQHVENGDPFAQSSSATRAHLCCRSFPEFSNCPGPDVAVARAHPGTASIGAAIRVKKLNSIL
jgi:hypothetical protein